MFHISVNKTTSGSFWVGNVLLGHYQPTVARRFVGTTFVPSWQHYCWSNAAASPRLTSRASAGPGQSCCPWDCTHCYATAGADQENDFHSCYGISGLHRRCIGNAKGPSLSFPALYFSEQSWICSQMSLHNNRSSSLPRRWMMMCGACPR